MLNKMAPPVHRFGRDNDRINLAAAVKTGPFATSALDNDIGGPGTKRNAAPTAILLMRAENAQATAIGKPGAIHRPYAVGLSRPAASMLLPELTPDPLTTLAVERRNACGALRPGLPTRPVSRRNRMGQPPRRRTDDDGRSQGRRHRTEPDPVRQRERIPQRGGRTGGHPDPGGGDPSRWEMT